MSMDKLAKEMVGIIRTSKYKDEYMKAILAEDTELFDKVMEKDKKDRGLV